MKDLGAIVEISTIMYTLPYLIYAKYLLCADCSIMYVGVVDTLSNPEQSVGLYLSHDGGFSWKEVVTYIATYISMYVILSINFPVFKI